MEEENKEQSTNEEKVETPEIEEKIDTPEIKEEKEAPIDNSEKEQKDEEEPQEDKEEITADKAKETSIDDATNVLKDKGFDYVELQKEYNEKGEITKETREKLAKVGITDEILDNYIEGQKARVERELDELSECIGGRKVMNEVIQWAANNISDEEKASINNITDANVMRIVLKDLKNRMEEKEGKVPENQITGEGGKPPVELFESQAQMFEAIKDPRYKKDEAYRAKVMKKIQASREAGIDLGI